MTDLAVTVETESFTISPQVDGSIDVFPMIEEVVVAVEVPPPLNVTPTVSVPVVVQPVVEEVMVMEVGIPGPPGSPGDPGPTGPAGPPPAGAGRYVHEQSVASTDWLVVHGLGAFPSAIIVVDTAGTVVSTEIRFVDLNSFRVLSTAPFSGKVYTGT